MKLPKISIITPSYNQGQFIKETIDSVLSQNYPNLEYIVMDGGSTDDTISILKSYGGKIKWISKKDKGQTDAINKGLELATGDILAYLNSDDVMLSNTLNKIAKFFKENKNAAWVTGSYQIVDENSKIINSFAVKSKTLLRKIPNKSTLLVANYIIQPSTFWRRSLVDEIGFFNESLHYCMDFDYWLRVIEKFKLYTLPDKLSSFRIHGNSKGGVLYKKQFEEEHRLVKEYTNNVLLKFIHFIHYKLIILIYSITKRG